MILRSTLHQSQANVVNVGNCLIIINQVIECVGSTDIILILRLVVTITVDTTSSVGNTQCVVTELRTELDTITQTV